MSPLHRKLLRDLLRLKGQVLTIALVLMSGVASWVSLRATYDSLFDARAAYYERQRFGDVFADCVRAPVALKLRLSQIAGVTSVSTTVVEPVRILIASERTPPIGVVIGLPADGAPAVDAPRLMAGRFPDPTAADEVVLLESFAKSHTITVGDRVEIVAAGAQRNLRVVGWAVSPEYLFAMAPGDMTADVRGFGVLWMGIDAVQRLTNKEGAFDHASFSLEPQADQAQVIADVDALLRPWGGVGAYGRDTQASDRMLTQELTQLRGMALVAPAIFLAVAAFLLNVVLGRLIALERTEIATLRAMGYTALEVARHYVELVMAISVVGAAFGVAFGDWFGKGMVALYAQYFHFPDPPFVLDASVVAVGVLVSVGAALTGALSTIRRITRLPPAEAMRPPAPASYKRGLLEKLRLLELLAPSTRMVLREATRRPGRLAISVTALSFAVAINVVARVNGDVLDEFLTAQFSVAMREDLAVTFRRPVDERAVRALGKLASVTFAEPLRTAPITVANGARERDRVLIGHPESTELRNVLDRYGNPVAIPPDGLALDETTAELLGVSTGDSVTVSFLEGERRTRQVRVGAVFPGLTAMEVHVGMAFQASLSGERGVTAAMLSIEPRARDEVTRSLMAMPEVLSATSRQDAIRRFQETNAETMQTMTLILTLFASILAVGVVYNDARIVLSSQSRELASLRVLGFERHEVSAILLGQLALEVGLCIAPGLVLGKLMADWVLSTADPELFQFPAIIRPQTYAMSALVVILSAVASALLVRRRVDHLNLIEVLKTRD